MAKIVYSLSVTALQSTTLETKTFEAVESDIGKSLSGGNNALTWAGGAVTDWAAGVHDHKTSDADTIVGNSHDGVWIKHSGYDYDGAKDGNIDRSSPNTANVTISVGGSVIATLAPGEPVFFPAPGTVTYTLGDDGTPAAVEYAILT